MLIKFKNWLTTRRQQRQQDKEHQKELRQFKTAGTFSPYYNWKTNISTIGMGNLLCCMLITSLVASVGSYIVTIGYQTICQILAEWIHKVWVTGGMKSTFPTLYGGFSMAVIALSCITAQVMMWATQLLMSNPDSATTHDCFAEMDDRFQDRAAEILLSQQDIKECLARLEGAMVKQ